MAKIEWDEIGERLFETGTDHGVLYPISATGTYPAGVAWNGLTGVSEKPSGAESNKKYADNLIYLNLLSAEEFGATVTAFTYPPEFAPCNGEVEAADGVIVGQQNRQGFGLSYRTLVGNDVNGTDFGYKINLVYNALAAPSEKAFATVNETPDAIEFSWELTTTPVEVGEGFKPSAKLTIDSTKVNEDDLAALEAIIYGGTETTARLPLPEEVITIFAGG